MVSSPCRKAPSGSAGRGGLLRYYRIEGGTHVDSLYDVFPDNLRPLTPCHRSAFTALEAWIGHGRQPVPSHTVARPEGAGPGTLLEECSLAGKETGF